MRIGASTRILAIEIGEIELIDHLNYEAAQMIFIEPIIHRWQQQVVGLQL